MSNLDKLLLEPDCSLDDVPEGKEGLQYLLDNRELVFPWTREGIYVNNAALVPAHAFAVQAAIEYRLNNTYNFSDSVDANTKRIEEVRAAAAQLLGCESDEIAFTQNTGSGINLVAQGMKWEQGDEIIVQDCSPSHEYPSNYLPWVAQENRGAKVIKCSGEEGTGFVSPEEIKENLTEKTRMVALSSVGFQTGQLVDVSTIGNMIRRHNLSFTLRLPGPRKPTLFSLDIVQQLGGQRFDMKACDADFVSSGSQKLLMAGDGMGIVGISRRALDDLENLCIGSESMNEWNDPSSGRKNEASTAEVGTRNNEGIWRVGAAIDLIQRVGIDIISDRIYELTSRLCDGLERKGYVIFSPRGSRGETSSIVMVSKPSWEEELATAKSPEEIAVLGKKYEQDMQQAGVKFSIRGGRMRLGIHYYNTEEEIDRIIELFAKI